MVKYTRLERIDLHIANRYYIFAVVGFSAILSRQKNVLPKSQHRFIWVCSMKTKNDIILFYLSCAERVHRVGRNTTLGNSSCYLWSENQLTEDGEPILRIRGLELYPQDILYRWYYGEPLDRRNVEFLCRYRRCINPQHIRKEFDVSTPYFATTSNELAQSFTGSASHVWRPSVKESQKRVIPLPIKRKVFALDNFECVYCGFNMNLTIDHFIPYTRGGDNSIKNYVTACWDCNGKKGNRYYWQMGMELKGGRFRQKAS